MVLMFILFNMLNGNSREEKAARRARARAQARLLCAWELKIIYSLDAHAALENSQHRASFPFPEWTRGFLIHAPRSSSSPCALALLAILFVPFCACEGEQRRKRAAVWSNFQRRFPSQNDLFATRTFRVKYAGVDLHKEKVVYLCVLRAGSSDLVINIAWARKQGNWVLFVYGAVWQTKLWRALLVLCLGKCLQQALEKSKSV